MATRTFQTTHVTLVAFLLDSTGLYNIAVQSTHIHTHTQSTKQMCFIVIIHDNISTFMFIFIFG